MKVLFVRSGNNGIDPISTMQGMSLSKKGLEVLYFDVIGKGLVGYLKNIKKLKLFIKKTNPDIIHAHYSFCGFVSVLTFSGLPIIVSLMGSDIKSDNKFKWIIKFFSFFLWDETIVKSIDLKNHSGLKKALVIPNGVDLDKFYHIPKIEAREHLKWNLNANIILFMANPKRAEKNWALAEKAISLLNFKVEVKSLIDIPIEEMVYYYNATDIALLTSFDEGSPNVIKEAMACNCPIVSTNVGDVEWVFRNTKGCYISSEEPNNVVEKIQMAFEFLNCNKDTVGRQCIIELGLDAENVAQRILTVYKNLLK